MGRGAKVSSKRKFKKRVRSNDKGSDDSDEDYVVSEDENEVSDYSDEDYHSSVDGHASEESFGSFVEGEEEEEGTVKRVKKVGRSNPRKRARKFIVEEEEEEEEEKDEDEDEDEEMNEVNTAARSKLQRRFSGPQKNRIKTSQRRRRVTYKEDEDDDDDEEFTPNNDEEDEDDDEFTPYDNDCSDEEESRAKRKKNNAKAGKRVLQKKGPTKGQRRRRKSVASKKPIRKKVRKTRGFRRKVRSDDDDDDGGGDFIDNGLVLREKSEMKRARRRYVVPSDSDFASSGSSEYEYTISEEEREQVREAREYCRRLKTNLRSSLMCNKIQEDVVLQPERKPTGRKGKEKVEEVKAEVVKQVCGICLSEEDKRKVRGTLNCCTHYFCYPCIMEWAKVESRCPLCKQRFNTISKPARNTAGIDLREVVVEVPERDQVYQPSEEELRSYIDPYENVICTECHEGGDDGLMLLCDLCDSPAHTYCVGLGREVPEGNWYCDGCRPVAIGSSSSLAQTRFSDQRTTSNSVSDRASTVTNHFGEGLDISSISSQGLGSLSSPRYHHSGGFHATSPIPGAGAPTLSGRRLIHRHIQQLLSANRMGHMADRREGNSSANMIGDLLNSPLDQGRETPRQHASAQETVVPFHAFFQERLRENPSTAVQDTDLFSPRMIQVRRQMGQDLTTASADGPSNRSLWPGLAERNSPLNFEQQLRQCNGPNNGCDSEETDLHSAKEQLNSMIKSHLKNLSRDSNLAQNLLMDIAKSSTHTILAACELEHKSNEVVAVPVSPPPICGHIELFSGSKASLMRGRCSSCFDSFVGEVVKKILDTKLSEQWLSLGL